MPVLSFAFTIEVSNTIKASIRDTMAKAVAKHYLSLAECACVLKSPFIVHLHAQTIVIYVIIIRLGYN